MRDRPRRAGTPADRGRARRRQDDARQEPGAQHRLQLQAAPVHARPAAERRHRRLDLQPADRRVRVSARPDRGPGRARRRDQSRHAQDPVGPARGDGGAPDHASTASPAGSRRRSSCSPRRIRSSTRARSHCPRRSSTASCCASILAIPSAAQEVEVLQQQVLRHPLEDLAPVVQARDLEELQRAVRQVHVQPLVQRYIVRHRRADAQSSGRVPGRQPARQPRTDALEPGSGAAPGPRLRHRRTTSRPWRRLCSRTA